MKTSRMDFSTTICTKKNSSQKFIQNLNQQIQRKQPTKKKSKGITKTKNGLPSLTTAPK